MRTICIVEDDLGISASLKLYLENSDFNVITYETGDGASEMILEKKPDLVILDINLPKKTGIEVCSEVRVESDTPIIMLTARGGEIDKITGLDAGADDYIAKPFSPRELLARINSILRRSSDNSINAHIITYDDIIIDSQKMEVSLAGEIIAVTKNEYDILEKIAGAGGNLVTREALMKEVIGYDNYVYDRTIDTHIKNLRRKLGKKDMILTIRGKGYRLNT